MIYLCVILSYLGWLGEVGKNNKMFYFPMVFMLAATLTSLVITVINKCKAIGAGTAASTDNTSDRQTIGRKKHKGLSTLKLSCPHSCRFSFCFPLRKKLQLDCITTIRNVGYKLERK